MILDDNFSISGKTLEEFAKAADKMEAATLYQVARMDIMQVLSIDHVDDENIYVYRLPHTDVWKDNGPNRALALGRQKINRQQMASRGVTPEVMKQVIDLGFMLMSRNKIFFVSKDALSTLSQRLGTGCDRFYRPGFARDLLIADCLNGVSQFVIRSAEGINKIFAFLSEKYTHTPQKFFVDLVNEINRENVMGRCECYGWTIGQEITRLSVVFPDKEQEVAALYRMPGCKPGIVFETSDVGECALRATAVWICNNHHFFTDEVSRRHVAMNEEEMKDFIEECRTNIFDQFNHLPEALCRQMMEQITETAADTDLKQIRQNQARIKDAFRKASKELGLVKVIGKKREKALMEQLAFELDPKCAYTAYDLTQSLISMPERVTGISEEMTRALRKAVGKAPYVTYAPAKDGMPVLVA